MSDYPKPKLGSKEHIAGTVAAIGATAYFVNKKPKSKGLKAPTAKTEAKVAQRIKADLDKGTTIVDDEGNLRSKTTVNNADQRFR